MTCAGFIGLGTPVPGMGTATVAVRENAAETLVPGATTVGRRRPSIAGPREEVPAIPRMSSDGNPTPGRDVSELPTTMSFLVSCGAPMLCGRPPSLPAAHTIARCSSVAVPELGSRTPRSITREFAPYPLPPLLLAPQLLFMTARG